MKHVASLNRFNRIEPSTPALRQAAFDYYVNKGESLDEVARRFGCSHESVRQWVKSIDKTKLKKRGIQVNLSLRARIKQQLLLGHRYRDIADDLGCSYQWVARTAAAVEIRNPKCIKPRARVKASPAPAEPTPTPAPVVRAVAPRPVYTASGFIRPLSRDELMVGSATRSRPIVPSETARAI